MAIPVIQPPLYGYGQVGRAFKLNLHALNDPLTWSGLSLPPGLSVTELVPSSGTWVLTGTPTVAGVYTAEITASNGDGDDTEDYLITVVSSLTPFYTGPKGFAMEVGTPFSRFLPWTNSPSSYTSLTTLPSGITLNLGTGQLSGTPTLAGTFDEVFIQAANGSGIGENVISLEITDPGPPSGNVPVVDSPPTATAEVGALFMYQITGTNSPARFDIANEPLGMRVHKNNGLIEWTPATAGVFTVDVFAENLDGISEPFTVTITVTDDGGGGGGGGGGGLPPPPDVSGPGNFTYREANPFAEAILAPCHDAVQTGLVPSEPLNFRIFVSGTPGDTTAHASWNAPENT